MINSNIWQNLRQNPLLFPIYVPTLIFSFCSGMLTPVLPLYALAFDAPLWLVGIVLAGEALGMLLSDVPAGVILRQLGQKRSMLLGIVTIAISGGALFVAPSIWMVVLFRVAAGASLSLFTVARHAYLSEMVRLTNRGKAMAVFGGINRIGGSFAGPIVGGYIASAFGLRSIFLLFAGLILLAFVVVAFSIRAATANRRETLSQLNLSHLFHTVQMNYQVLIPAGMAQLFAQMIRAGRKVIIPLYAAEVIGLGVEDVGLIVGISGFVDMLLFPIAGWVMDRWGRKFAILPCFSIQAFAMALIPFTDTYASLLFVACLMGFGNGLGSGTMMTLGADLSPDDTRGEFLGVWRLIGDAGMTGAPIIVGVVANVLVLSSAALVMAGSGLIAVLIFAFFVPETLKKHSLPVKPVVEAGD